MKRTNRTKLVLSPLIVITIFASALAYRSGSETIVTTSRASEAPDPEDEKKNSLINTTPAALITAKPIGYSIVKLQGQKSIKELEARLGPSLFATVLKINRLDRKHLSVTASLVVPDGDIELASISPLPRKLEAARSIPKLLLVSRQAQAFGA